MLFNLLQNAMTAAELSGREEELNTQLDKLQDSRAALETSQAALEVDRASQERATTDLQVQMAAETAAWHGETAPCILSLLQFLSIVYLCAVTSWYPVRRGKAQIR